jgi:carbamoyl-phosphate synthase small subunit
MEAMKPWHDGFIVRELSRVPSNFRSENDINSFLKANDIPGIQGVDTRALTKILREKGTMNGMITTRQVDPSEVLEEIKAYQVKGVVKEVSCKEKQVFPGDGFKVALMDFGAKKNIARSLVARGCQVTVYPAWTTAEEIIADQPDGIMLSNGPGDPKECTEIIEELKKLFATNIPIFAICLGHQLMALANGADTEKMKYGHRGANHPVKDMKSGRVYISSQNHGYVVKEDTLDRNIAEVSFLNVNDGTVEGVHYLGKNVLTVQFHPEASPGPKDSAFLFDEFINMMEVAK